MAYEMKDGDFSLFKNDKKTEDKHPDYTGKILINGTKYNLSAWIKKGDKGAFFSGQATEWKGKANSEPVDDPLNPVSAPQVPPADGGDLPF